MKYYSRKFCYANYTFNGLQGIAAEWCRLYLTDRKQKVEIRSPSNTLNFSSILGPLLFIMYVNDLPPTINTLSEPIFADDTSVTMSNKKFDDFCRMST
jgi:hypothetical protein